MCRARAPFRSRCACVCANLMLLPNSTRDGGTFPCNSTREGGTIPCNSTIALSSCCPQALRQPQDGQAAPVPLLNQGKAARLPLLPVCRTCSLCVARLRFALFAQRRGGVPRAHCTQSPKATASFQLERTKASADPRLGKAAHRSAVVLRRIGLGQPLCSVPSTEFLHTRAPPV